MKEPTRHRETLEERVARLDVRQRDCRDCKLFTPSPTGLAFGWCRAHEQYVKLYHGHFWSQCQFKTIARAAGPPTVHPARDRLTAASEDHGGPSP